MAASGHCSKRLNSVVPNLSRCLTHIGIPVKAVDVASTVARDLYERDIVVVRPDQHVAWRGNADPPDAADVVAQMTGNRS